MNKGSIYGKAKGHVEEPMIHWSTGEEIRKGFKRFFEKRGIDIDEEYAKPQVKANHEPKEDRRSLMKAVAYGRRYRKESKP